MYLTVVLNFAEAEPLPEEDPLTELEPLDSARVGDDVVMGMQIYYLTPLYHYNSSHCLMCFGLIRV